MGTANGSPASDWSKDFVEHLRTVHFFVVTVSLALLVLISAANRDLYFRAVRQVRQLENVRVELNEAVRRILSSVAIAAAKQAEDEAKKRNREFPNHDPKQDIPKISAADLSSKRLRVTDVGLDFRPSIDIADLCTDDEGQAALADYPLRTIHEIRVFWKALLDGHTLSCIAEVAEPVCQVDGRVSNCTSSTVLAGLAKTDNKIALSADPQTGGTKRLHGTAKVTDHNVELVFDVISVPKLRVSLESLATADPEHFSPSAFETSFPELDRLANLLALDDEKLDKSVERLSVHLDKPEDAITIFGVSFAASQVTIWGYMILIGIQLYFWIHLRELTDRITSDGAGWNVAWIGMYSRPSARLTSKMSAAAMPLVATFMLARLAVDMWSFAAAGVSLLMAVLSYRQFKLLSLKNPYKMAISSGATVSPFGELGETVENVRVPSGIEDLRGIGGLS